MEEFKKHLDTIAIILTVISSVLWVNNSFNQRFNTIEKEIAIIKTVLVMKDLMPKELDKHNIEIPPH